MTKITSYPTKTQSSGYSINLVEKTSVIDDLYPDILSTVFVAAPSIPDNLSLKIMKHPRAIARKIDKHIFKD
jgi:hypothetical protein